MSLVYSLILFLFGSAVGSFFNVLVLRYNPEGKLFDLKRIGGRSHCPYCLNVLRPKELIPIFSFFIQKGKCNYCGKKISFFYPWVEFLTGVITVSVPYFLNSFYKVNNFYFWSFKEPLLYYFLVLVWIFIALILWLIILFDFKYYLIPNELNFALLFFGVILSFLISYNSSYFYPFKNSFLENYNLIFSFSENVLVNHLAGAFLGGLFFIILVLISKGKGMGMGDVKLAFSLGAVLGWADIALSIILAFILGGIIGAVLLIFKLKGLKDKIPFAPVLILGVLITILWGKKLLDVYFKLFGI